MMETKPTPNQKLRYERERRGWSQQEVADKVGITPLNNAWLPLLSKLNYLCGMQA